MKLNQSDLKLLIKEMIKSIVVAILIIFLENTTLTADY